MYEGDNFLQGTLKCFFDNFVQIIYLSYMCIDVLLICYQYQLVTGGTY